MHVMSLGKLFPSLIVQHGILKGKEKVCVGSLHSDFIFYAAWRLIPVCNPVVVTMGSWKQHSCQEVVPPLQAKKNVQAKLFDQNDNKIAIKFLNINSASPLDRYGLRN